MPLLHLELLPRRTTKSALLAFIGDVGHMDRRLVGRIELHGDEATIEVPESRLVRLAKKLDGAMFANRCVRAWADVGPDASTDGEDHFERLARLLELESRAEARQVAERNRRLSAADAERSGTSLVGLAIVDEDAGLGGRHLVQLAKRNRSPLPWTRLGVGSPVVLSAPAAKGGNGAADGHRGVVYQQSDSALRVALARMPDDLAEHDAWRLDLADDEVAAKRQRAAMAKARSARGDRTAELRDVLLGRRQPEFDPQEDERPLDPALNGPQREAVGLALAARDLALIHGPPGTGKTTAVVEVIRRSLALGRKVLACAPSNMAVDNIFERLLAAGAGVVRLGHPARVTADLRAHTLDLLVEDHPDVRLARKLVKEAMGLFRRAGRYTRAKPAPGGRQATRQEARSLLADARRLEAQAVEQILDSADVLCATTTGLDDGILGPRRFDLAVIDEACQSVEPGCWIPLLRCDRVVLAGDHCQLPPTVVSREAADQGFAESLFERLMAVCGDRAGRLLAVQYRMNRAIMDFSALEFYEARLEADASVADHVLADLPGVAALRLTETPAEFIDTAGAGFDEQIEPDGQSRLNRQEAELVCRKVGELLAAGVAPDRIGVIAPYAAQVRLLRERLAERPGLEIDSVDGFQGREKEAIIISLVRSNARGEIGFLKDVRRMNVAMTRARRKLLVVGDSATLSADPFYVRMLEYFEGLGAYRTVWEEDGGM